MDNSCLAEVFPPSTFLAKYQASIGKIARGHWQNLELS